MEKVFTKCPYCGSELTNGKLTFEGISGYGDAEAYVWGIFDDGTVKYEERGLFGRKVKVREKVSPVAIAAVRCDNCKKYFAVFDSELK